MIIDPILEGKKDKYSAVANLKNCIGYATNNNDLIMIRVDSGERLPSQTLNLKVIDLEDNLLRFTNDLEGESTMILKNLNNDPTTNELNNKRANIIDKISLGLKKPIDQEKAQKLLNNDQGKNMIYVCFDNIINDKSWSFEPLPREVILDVHLRDISKMTETNYNMYSRYFRKFQENDNDAQKLKDMNEEQFDQEITVVENELNNVIESLENSELIMKSLIDQESKLRDTNERIYSLYTIFAVVILVTIGIFGLFQTFYFKRYLKTKLSHYIN